MKIKLIAIFASFVFPSIGIAHETAAPAPVAVVTPAPVIPATPMSSTNWSGFYAGALASFDSGTYTSSLNGGPVQNPALVFDAATGFGGFIGYNIQNGSMVYGGELAFTNSQQVSASFPGSSFSGSLDAKLRVGQSTGRALVYGVIGYSFNEFVSGGNGNFATQGVSFGAGVDVMITDRLFVGGEFLIRNLSADGTEVPELRIEANTQALQIRAGIKF